MRPRKKRVDTRNAAIARRGDYSQTLDAIVAGGFCPFCEEHLFKHHRKPLIFKGKYWLVTENAWPYEGSRHHFLFIARTHIEKTERMPKKMWAELQDFYKKLVKKHGLKGGTLMIRSGDTRITGASVNHLHAQLIVGAARKKKSKNIHALVGFQK